MWSSAGHSAVPSSELKKKKMQMPLRDGQFQNGLVRTTKFNSSLALLEPAKILLMPGGCHGDSHFKPRSVMILN